MQSKTKLTIVAIAELIVGIIGSIFLMIFLLMLAESYQNGVGPGLGGIFFYASLSFLFPAPVILISGILILAAREKAEKMEYILSEIVRSYYILAVFYNLFFNIIGLLFCLICLGVAIKKIRFLKHLE